jgi:hypothetical protein
VVTVLAASSVAEARLRFSGMDWVEEHRLQLEGNVNGAIYLMEGGHNRYRRNAGQIAAIV